jgi:hypothetical protein
MITCSSSVSKQRKGGYFLMSDILCMEVCMVAAFSTLCYIHNRQADSNTASQ